MVAVQTPLRRYEDLPGPAGWPLLGNLLQLRYDRFHAILEDWAAQYGPLYRIRIGPRRLAVVSDADIIRRMHRERPDMFRRTRAVESATAEMRMKGVFSSEGDDWRRQRKIVAMALNTAHLKPFYPHLRTITARLQRRQNRPRIPRKRRPLSRSHALHGRRHDTARVRHRFQHARNPGPGDPAEPRQGVPGAQFRVNAPFAYWRYFKLPRDRELDRALAQVQQQVDGSSPTCAAACRPIRVCTRRRPTSWKP